ncbi:MAG: hypothetical protein C4325_06930 [Blastocatellia bacterium]
MMPQSFSRVCFLLSLIFVLVASPVAFGQKKMDRIERERLKTMLRVVKETVKDNYFDPSLKGIDIDAKYQKSVDRIDQVDFTGQALGVIAQFLADFDDSHLFFLPPALTTSVEYGWRDAFFGDKLVVWLVKPGSDAEAKGLKRGDQILSIEGFTPVKKEMWKVRYFYNVVSKRSLIRLKVLSPGDSAPRDLEIASKITKLPRAIDRNTLFTVFDTSGKSDIEYNYFKPIGNIMVWKMPSFSIEPADIDTMIGKVRSSPNLILDLRGNGGGLVKTLERLTGWFFDRDIKIADLKGRKKMDPMEAKSMGQSVYKGNLIVLLDSQSASAAEIFARVVQLEQRGVVLGDVSAGAVMQSVRKPLSMGGNDEILYGVSVTNADVIMSDGKSLEHVGVIPNQIVLTTPSDLAADRDPVLAMAVKLLGGDITPEQAGKIFQYKWRESGNNEIIEIVVN